MRGTIRKLDTGHVAHHIYQRLEQEVTRAKGD